MTKILNTEDERLIKLLKTLHNLGLIGSDDKIRIKQNKKRSYDGVKKSNAVNVFRKLDGRQNKSYGNTYAKNYGARNVAIPSNNQTPMNQTPTIGSEQQLSNLKLTNLQILNAAKKESDITKYDEDLLKYNHMVTNNIQNIFSAQTATDKQLTTLNNLIDFKLNNNNVEEIEDVNENDNNYFAEPDYATWNDDKSKYIKPQYLTNLASLYNPTKSTGKINLLNDINETPIKANDKTNIFADDYFKTFVNNDSNDFHEKADETKQEIKANDKNDKTPIKTNSTDNIFVNDVSNVFTKADEVKAEVKTAEVKTDDKTEVKTDVKANEVKSAEVKSDSVKAFFEKDKANKELKELLGTYNDLGGKNLENLNKTTSTKKIMKGIEVMKQFNINRDEYIKIGGKNDDLTKGYNAYIVPTSENLKLYIKAGGDDYKILSSKSIITIQNATKALNKK
jgi:hypothetical protein